MKGRVIYKSKYGSTKQFAIWIAEATGFPLYDIKNCPKSLHDLDVILLAGSIHAGSVSVKDYVTLNWSFMKDKKIVLILTSGTSNGEVINKVVEESFTPEMLRVIKVFPVGGRYLLSRMGFIDRNIIKLVARFTKSPEARKGMLTEKDEVNRESLQEIMDFLYIRP